MKRTDLIETYEIIIGKEDIESKNLFSIAANDHGLRGHQLRIYAVSQKVHLFIFQIALSTINRF